MMMLLLVHAVYAAVELKEIRNEIKPMKGLQKEETMQKYTTAMTEAKPTVSRT